MSRDIETALADAFADAGLNPILLAVIETADGTVRAWTGIGNIDWDGNTFQGIGALGQVSRTEETIDGTATGMVYSLSGIDASLISYALNSIRPGNEARLYFGALDENGKMKGTPVLVDRGLTDVPEIEDSAETATVRITTESRGIDKRARVRRYTTEDQAIDYPSDRGFEKVEGLQDRKIKWGKR